MTSCVRSIFAPSAHQKHTVGDTKTSVIPNDHLGWLKCDGRSIAVSDYYFLFKVIGYSFGGSGSNFTLPKGAGTVPAIVGTGTDANLSTFKFKLGQQVGEYVHTLTIPEIPEHNHGVANAIQNGANSTTSINYTGIGVNYSTTGVYDSGHSHEYNRSNSSNNSNADALGITSSPNNEGTYTSNTNSGNAQIVDPSHRHSITDPGHFHTLHAAGGSLSHNNVQPSLPVGHLFIFSGRINDGVFPYTAYTNVM